MPINPQIALGIQPSQAPDLFGSVGKALQLKGLITQQENMAADRDYRLGELLHTQKLRNAFASLPPGPEGDAARLDLQAQFGGDPVKTIEARGKYQTHADETLGQFALGLAIAPSDQRAAQYETLRPDLLKRGINVPETFSPDFIDQALAKSQKHAGALEHWQNKRTAEEFWASRQQPQDLRQQASFAPGSTLEIKPLQDGIPYSTESTESMQVTTPPVTATATRGADANSPVTLRAQADFAERRGNTALAMKYRGEADRVEKTLAEVMEKDPLSRLMRRMQTNPNLPEYEQRAVRKAIAHQLGYSEEWTVDADMNPVREEAVGKVKDARAEKSAARVSIGTYEKTRDKQLGEGVGKAYDAADGAYTTADEVRAIADSLKGYSGGQFQSYAAKLGEYAPWAVGVTSANQLAESIRARVAPQMRTAGSGSTSDMEMKQYLSALPSLVTSEAGRSVMVSVANKVAERAAYAAEMKDEMVSAGKYSPRLLREAMLAKFGPRLLDDAEVSALKTGKPMGSAPTVGPSDSFKSLWRK